MRQWKGWLILLVALPAWGKPAQLTFSTIPNETGVWVNGTLVGKAGETLIWNYPTTAPVLVELRLTGYQTRVFQVTANEVEHGRAPLAGSVTLEESREARNVPVFVLLAGALGLGLAYKFFPRPHPKVEAMPGPKEEWSVCEPINDALAHGRRTMEISVVRNSTLMLGPGRFMQLHLDLPEDSFSIFLDAKGAAQLNSLVRKALEKSPTLPRLACEHSEWGLPQKGHEVGRVICSNPSTYPKLPAYSKGRTILIVRSHNAHVEACGGYDIQVSLEYVEQPGPPNAYPQNPHGYLLEYFLGAQYSARFQEAMEQAEQRLQ